VTFEPGVEAAVGPGDNKRIKRIESLKHFQMLLLLSAILSIALISIIHRSISYAAQKSKVKSNQTKQKTKQKRPGQSPLTYSRRTRYETRNNPGQSSADANALTEYK